MNKTLLAQAVQLEYPMHFTHQGNRWAQSYDMPFASIAAAFGVVGGALAGTGAAVTTGTLVAASLTVVSTIATFASLALSVVGAITGNEDLMKIGGYVGLAGAVTGIGASLAGAGNLATTAGTQAASGSTAAGQSAKAVAPLTQTAVQPAVTAGTNVAAPATHAANTATQTATEGAGLLGSAGQAAQEAITPVGLQALETGGKFGAEIGQIGAQTPVAQTTSFFDELMKPQSLLEIGKIGAGALGGLNESDKFDRLYDLKKDQLDYEIGVDQRQNRNANFQGRGMLQTRALTDEERDAAAVKKAVQAKKMAKILTAPAGSK